MFYLREATYASLAYRHHNPDWDLARNLTVYGEDHSVVGLGANMTIWLEVAGDLQPKTGLLIPENSLAPHLQRAKELLDHRSLFDVEPWFQSHVSTLENIALFLRDSIWSQPPPRGRWHRLTLEEN